MTPVRMRGGWSNGRGLSALGAAGARTVKALRLAASGPRRSELCTPAR